MSYPSSVGGGPGETSAEGIFVRASPLGVRITGGALGVTKSNIPHRETSSVCEGVRGVPGLESVGGERDVAGGTSVGTQVDVLILQISRGVNDGVFHGLLPRWHFIRLLLAWLPKCLSGCRSA